MKHPCAPKVTAALVAILVTAVAAAAATAGNGNDKKTTKKVAALTHQIATLKAQNQRLHDQFSPAGIKQQLANTKSALDKYQNVKQAEADGYKAESPCESTPTDPNQTSYGGAMGIHYVNDQILRSGALDPKKPPILVYLPSAGGGVQLVAAEYFKPDADQNTHTDNDRPSLFGRGFDGPMQGHAPGMPIHYDLHVWLWQHNPSGMFASWNPAASC